MINFEQLLATTGNQNVEKLKARQTELQKQRTSLQENLAKVTRELQEIQAELAAPIKNAVKAAQLLGIEVPEEYLKSNGNG